ncbi:hypothetical protein F4774DRAFT_379290 [Daldinia eschscholtzii]|nr:hypothetical protein F4774DRAFT_379290 [Daldinia eschscholtzii]
MSQVLLKLICPALSPDPLRQITTMCWYHYLVVFLFGFYIIKTTISFFTNRFTFYPTLDIAWVTRLRKLDAKDDNTRLTESLTGSQNLPALFVTISVNTGEANSTKIKDIGISVWHTNIVEESEIESYHWRIIENMEDEHVHTISDIETFAFGDSEDIHAAEISDRLNTVLGSSVAEFSNTTIIGYDTQSMKELLRDHWRLPASVEMLDTERIWQIQHRRSDRVPLEIALDTTPGVVYEKGLLHNAGNEARFTLLLLQAQGRVAHEFRNAIS